MIRFGKIPPRSLQSFGVAGLLGEDCKVLYNSLFSTRHLGKVSDLISAQLQKTGADELRLRSIILFGIFRAYRSQINESKRATSGILSSPLVVECGIDSEKVAIGIAFTFPESEKIEWQGLAERLQGGTPQDDFEELLHLLQQHSDQLVLRIQPSIRRFEMISLMGIPGKIADEELNQARPIEFISIAQNAEEAPSVSEYIELGDLNYSELLKDELAFDDNNKTVTEEILAHLTAPSDLLDKTIVKGSVEDNALQEAIRIKRQQEALDKTVTRIEGATEHLKEDVVLVKGSEDSAQNPELAPNAQTRMYIEKIEELQKRIAELEEKRGESEQASEEVEEKSQGLGGFLRKSFSKVKNVWPFNKNLDDEDDAGENIEMTESVDQAAGESDEDKASESDPTLKSESEVESNTEVESDSKTLIMEIESGGFSNTISKAQKEAAEINKELTNAKAKKWAEGLLEELYAEKARLSELARKLNQSVRKVELDFKSKERALQEEIRRREEMLRTKNIALARTKDQLAQVQMNMERLKFNNQSKIGDTALKTKLDQTTRILSVTKEENASLHKKIDELRKSLASAQLASATQKQAASSSADLVAMQSKYERTRRQLEESKRMNKQLMDRLAQAESQSGPINAKFDEAKRRLAQAVAIATARQKELDQLRVRMSQAQGEEERLRSEVYRLREELERHKGRPSGGDSSSAA